MIKNLKFTTISLPQSPGKVRRFVRMVIQAIGFLGVSAHLAHHAVAADLSEVYQASVQSNPQFLAAQDTYRAQQEKMPQARSMFLPKVSADAFARRQGKSAISIHDTEVPSAWYDSQGYSLSVSQALFDPLALPTYRQAQLINLLAAVEFAQAKQQLILTVAKTYFEVLSATDDLRLIRDHCRMLHEQLTMNQRRLEAGAATIMDTNETEAQYNLGKADEIRALNQLALKKAALGQISGLHQPSLLALSDTLTPVPEALEQLAAFEQQAKRDHYSVQHATLSLAIARNEVKKSRAGYSPSASLVASHDYQRIQNTDTPQLLLNGGHNNRIGLEIHIPIFDGLITNSRVNEAVALKSKAENNIEEARRSARLDVQEAYLTLHSAAARNAALRTAERYASKAVDANRLAFAENMRLNTDLLEIENKRYQIQRDLLKARYEMLLEGLKLKAGIAALTEADIADLNSLLRHKTVSKAL